MEFLLLYIHFILIIERFQVYSVTYTSIQPSMANYSLFNDNSVIIFYLAVIKPKIYYLKYNIHAKVIMANAQESKSQEEN